MKWEKKKISELCEIKGGKRLPKNPEVYGDYVPFIKKQSG